MALDSGSLDVDHLTDINVIDGFESDPEQRVHFKNRRKRLGMWVLAFKLRNRRFGRSGERQSVGAQMIDPVIGRTVGDQRVRVEIL